MVDAPLNPIFILISKLIKNKDIICLKNFRTQNITSVTFYMEFFSFFSFSGFRISWLSSVEGKTPHQKECSRYDTKLHLIVRIQFWWSWKVEVIPPCCCYMLSNAMNSRRRQDFFNKYVPLTLFVRVRKGLLKVCVWEGVGDRTIFWPLFLIAVSVVSFSFSRAAQPEAQRPLCLVMAFFTASYQHLLRTSTHQGPKAPSAWCGFPYHISSITPTVCNSTVSSNSTELYTRSSGNNCHAVQRSLSSGASVYECTMGIF